MGASDRITVWNVDIGQAKLLSTALEAIESLKTDPVMSHECGRGSNNEAGACDQKVAGAYSIFPSFSLNNSLTVLCQL